MKAILDRRKGDDKSRHSAEDLDGERSKLLGSSSGAASSGRKETSPELEAFRSVNIDAESCGLSHNVCLGVDKLE